MTPQQAEEDNVSIYMSPVPDAQELPAMGSVQMAKLVSCVLLLLSQVSNIGLERLQGSVPSAPENLQELFGTLVPTEVANSR